MQNDTIAAIATAMSPSGIGIIRISGDDALSVIDRIYRSTITSSIFSSPSYIKP